MIVIINSFGYVLTIKKEENNIEQGMETDEKVDYENKSTLVIAPVKEITLNSQHIKNANDHIELSALQWCTSV